MPRVQDNISLLNTENSTLFSLNNLTVSNSYYDTDASNVIYSDSSIKQNYNELVFYSKDTWILKIIDKQIIFNTEQLTIDEITKEFLKTLSYLTHKDGLQYTFDF